MFECNTEVYNKIVPYSVDYPAGQTATGSYSTVL